jgi:hypothetical protein
VKMKDEEKLSILLDSMYEKCKVAMSNDNNNNNNTNQDESNNNRANVNTTSNTTSANTIRSLDLIETFKYYTNTIIHAAHNKTDTHANLFAIFDPIQAIQFLQDAGYIG